MREGSFPKAASNLIFGDNGHIRKMDNIRADIIRHALTVYGDRAETARRLNISRSTLYRYMRKYGLEDVGRS